MENKTGKLSFISKVGYAMGDCASQFVWTFVGAYLTIYYTDVVGLTPAVVSVIMLVARLWDAINDPMMGAIAERTKTRFGRFRPYILYGTPFLAVFGVLVFTNPDFGNGGKIAWAATTYIIAGMLYTLVNIPYGALGSVMTSNINERNALAAFRMNGMNIGMLIVNMSAMPLILFFSQADSANGRGYFYTSIVFCVIAFVLFYILFFTSKEVVQQVSKEKVPLKDTIKSIVKNKYLMMVFMMQLFVMLGFMGRMGVSIYYYTYIVKRMDLVGIFMTLPSIGSIIGILAVPKLTEMFGKKKVLVVSLFACALCLVWIYFIPAESVIMLMAATLIFGIAGLGAPIVLGMVPDCIDYAEYHTGVRSDGAAYATNGLASKAGNAVGSAVGILIMGAFGYVANAEQTAQALNGINITVNLFPAVMYVLAAIVAMVYNLDEKEVQKIRGELDKRNVESGK